METAFGDLHRVEGDFWTRWTYPTRFGPACGECAHLLVHGTREPNSWKCKAFPEGIPHTVLDGTEDHTDHLPYDEGYKYTPARIIEDDTCDFVWDWVGAPFPVKDKRGKSAPPSR